MLPESEIDPADYPRGPNGMAAMIEDMLSELDEWKRECRTKAERRPINQKAHRLRELLKWCETRAGYKVGG